LEAVAAAFCSYPGAYRRGVEFCCCFKEHTSYITTINPIGRDSVQAWFLNSTKTYKNIIIFLCGEELEKDSPLFDH
jgi:hypothetical protein